MVCGHDRGGRSYLFNGTLRDQFEFQEAGRYVGFQTDALFSTVISHKVAGYTNRQTLSHCRPADNDFCQNGTANGPRNLCLSRKTLIILMKPEGYANCQSVPANGNVIFSSASGHSTGNATSGRHVAFEWTKDFPSAIGTILSIKRDQPSCGAGECVIQVGPKVLGIYKPAQLTCLRRAVQGQAAKQLALW